MAYFTQCDFCTGTRWLQDNEFLGPCACVTPDNLREANDQIALDDANDPTRADYDEAAGALQEIADRIRGYLLRAGLDPNAVVQPDDDLDAIMDLLEPWTP